ncbi:PilZ domain-containing protein [Immundisolibacter sp.]|uniref:PilZ domain-containing protein n=1 Tax=Immundisolibacter sp. TaxID=1934948 RepID=UPI0026195B4E|nr:PilZ domain-containing protein [Immundisolibacter sp.]MDD3650573.1 PilZ domain-containing protein [Immundisolibacter sp.]
MVIERRRFTRIGLHVRAEFTSQDRRWACRAIDISLNGALVSRPRGWVGEQGDRCTLLFRLDEGTCIQMAAILRHQDRDALGWQCTGIDLDSMSELRRLVELNLGEPARMRRQLADMLREHVKTV